MEKYAVIQLGSKQFLVREKDIISVERQKIPLKADVLLFSNGSTVTLGTPKVDGVKVILSLVKEFKEKTRVARFKSKSRYHKVNGHKQPMSMLKVDSIISESDSSNLKETAPLKDESEVKKEAKPKKEVVKKAPVEKKTPTAKSEKTEKAQKSEKVKNKAVKSSSLNK